MPRPRLSDDRLLDRLADIFREHGYEGATLSIISDATGLQRSSLYHRFPGGKEEMAARVLDRVRDHLTSHVLAPLEEPGDPAVRVRHMGRRLIEFYGGGRKSCVLDTLTISDAPEVAALAKESYEGWAAALARLAREAGLPPAAARRRAEEALVRIEGALVVSRVRDDPAVFRRVVEQLPALLTE